MSNGLRRLLTASALWMLVLAAGAPRAADAPQGTGPVAGPVAAARPLLDQYCVSCHNARTKTGGLDLQGVDPARPGEHPEVWEKVARKLRGRMMPPPGMLRPSQETLDGLMVSLENALDKAALERPNPGRTALHRLNRSEYTNAIRDLLSLSVDGAALLPPDDESYGFDNIADVLGVSPLLMERYVAAAEKISALAVGDPSMPKAGAVYRLPLDFSQTDQVEGLPFGTRGGTLIHHTFPLDGEYVIKVKLWKSHMMYVRGLMAPHEVEISIDGERVHLATVGGQVDYRLNVVDGLATAAIVEGRLRPQVRVSAGPHDVAVTFLAASGGATTAPDLFQPFMSQKDPTSVNGLPAIESVTIEGPINPTAPRSTPSRTAIFTCRPTRAADEAACARTIVSKLARRAYRRPPSEVEVGELLELYTAGRAEGTFDGGIQLALQGLLTSPTFIFRAEQDPVSAAPGTAHRISDIELASRLSFFLWSSIPDDALLDDAVRGRLRNPAVLARQVRRMLADPKVDALVSNFGGQWLHLRNLRNAQPDYELFPDFDDNLRTALRQETEMLLGSIISENRNVVDLLTANYTFLNERLARHYRIPGIYGSQFRRITLTDPRRFGLLGQGSVLTVTSFGTRTSPVQRGRWVMENILGTPLPPPPANVPALVPQAKPKTMREQMEVHRANPSCANCHRLMDPLGFALENFDAVGAWREKDLGNAIDPSSVLADGTRLDGPLDLRQMVLRRPEMFVRTLSEKLLTYALGRGLEAYDMPVVRQVAVAASADQNRFSAIVLNIVTSTPFQMRMAPERPVDRVAAAPGGRR